MGRLHGRVKRAGRRGRGSLAPVSHTQRLCSGPPGWHYRPCQRGCGRQRVILVSQVPFLHAVRRHDLPLEEVFGLADPSNIP